MLPRTFLPSLFSITLLVLVVFAVLRGLQIPAGDLIDWVMGIAVFWWLMLIVTVPWNMHFAAKEILSEAEISERKAIKVDVQDIGYAQKIAKRYLQIAITMHVVSAVALSVFAYIGILPMGYWAALAALLLTFLRPAIRLHDYIVSKLSLIRQQIHYPREDVYELKTKVEAIDAVFKNLEHALDTKKEDSWANKVERQNKRLKDELEKLQVSLQNLKVENQSEHQQLARQLESSISKISEDSEFLQHARELIRFIKNS